MGAPWSKDVPKASNSRRSVQRPRFTASDADRHTLYQLAVQDVESEVDFLVRTFRARRRRAPVTLREDFCGTAAACCEWVRRSPEARAIGLDLDQPTLDWGLEHNVSSLTPDQRSRVRLLRRNVLRPGRSAVGVDIVEAMNFSYFIFKDRGTMARYFRSVRASLVRDGLFVLDFYGGWESMRVQTERRACKGFTYVWDQHAFDPVTGDLTCFIHFEFRDGAKMERAFRYDWRLWTLPELREVLAEAGFSSTTVYLEGDDGKGGGDGDFRPAKHGDADAAFLAYIVAER